MKKMINIFLIVFIISLFTTACVSFEEIPNKNFEVNIGKVDKPNVDDTIENTVEKEEGYSLSLRQINGLPMINLADLAAATSLSWEYDSIEGTIEIKDGYNNYKLIKNTTVISKNGIYQPNVEVPIIDDEETIFLPVSMLNYFDLTYEIIDNQTIAVYQQEESNLESVNSLNEFEQQFSNMDAEDIYNYLSFLTTPLAGSHVTSRDSQIPGAARDYRNGIHEGIDWYSGYTGILIDTSTPVLSMGDGIVVRADHNYTELTLAEREELLNIAAQIDHTPEYILDELRGRSVWVQYKNGVTVRYAHLSSIPPEINVGSKVKTGNVIGYVGNSGTSDGVAGTNAGLHLHSDILIYGHLFWEFLEQEEIKTVLEKLFPN